MSSADRAPERSGKEAEPGPIIDRILSELDRIGIGAEAASQKSMSWDDPEDRRRIREAFDDGGALEPLLPGFGELGRAGNAEDDCGDPHPFICDSCGQHVNMGRTCGRSICARCAQVWARDAAIQKSAKIRRVRIEQHQHTPENQLQKIHHLVVSPPPGWFYDLAREYDREEAQEITKEVVKDILQELGGQGELVRHSYRGKKPDGSLAAEADDRGLWKERVFSGRSWYGDVRDELAWKPHYHAIVVNDWIRADELTKAVEEATGWVIHRIQRRDGKSLETDKDAATALTYAISHSDIMVRPDANNRSAIWEVGSFDGDAIKSSPRFSPADHDLEWADAAVRDIVGKVLGIKAGSSDCGAMIPPVEDPNLLAIRILEDLYEDEETRDEIPNEAVLHHVSQGNIVVDVSDPELPPGSVSAGFAASSSSSSIASGSPPWTIGSGSAPWRIHGGSAPWSTPDPPKAASDLEPTQLMSMSSRYCPHETEEDSSSACLCGEHGPERGGSGACDGSLIPLDEARRRGLLESDRWLQRAAHADEALEADREWPEDLEPWRSSSPGKASPAIG